MKIYLDQSEPFNLDLTLCCGQAFRWDRIGGWWYGVAGGCVVKIRQVSETLEFEDATSSFIREYFALDDDLPTILLEISKDSHMTHVTGELEGLRILNQDPWECLLSFICATYKNIVSIKQMLSKLSRKYGEKIRFENADFHAFPTPDRLSKAKLAGLAKCGLGYRARYVSETARIVSQERAFLKKLETMSLDNARRELLRLPGVGQKVADCVLLFSLKKHEAFPVDVWVKRAVLEHYSTFLSRDLAKKLSDSRSISDSEYRRLSEFGRSYFGRYAGYAQEYLYHHERMRT